MKARVTIAGLVCGVLGLAAAGVGAGAPAEPSAALAPAAGCVVTGPSYSAGGMTSNKYRLSLKGVSCSFATAWMRKLVTKKAGKLPTKIAGPAGWKCIGSQVAPAWPLKAYQGECSKGTTFFGWHPYSPAGSGA